MAAVIRASIATLAGPTLASAEGGIKFNRSEGATDTTTPIPKPTSGSGTNYSWPKVLTLEVTTIDAATTISNRRIHRASAPAAGVTMWYKDDNDTYNRPAAVAAADNATTDDATPAGYSAMPSSATVYDAAGDSAGSLGRSGDYVSVALGISTLYTGGGSTNVTLPNIVMTYDEA
jgi:hypothetical protein